MRKQDLLYEIKTISLLLVVLFLGACERLEPDPNNAYSQIAWSMGSKLKIQTSERISVTRISVFKDEMAYDRQRGIYIIRDNETGKEFVGISGVGIAETGSHKSGKTFVSDER